MMRGLSRRTIIEFMGLGATMATAGCGNPRDGDRSATLRLFPVFERTESGWQMTVRVKNTTNNIASIHDVTVVAFNGQGEETCRIGMGDFPHAGRYEHTETVSCEGFPAIITAIAEETPCEGANIRLLYYVGETTPKDVANINDHALWDGTWRECNEELPPDRVLKKVSRNETATP